MILNCISELLSKRNLSVYNVLLWIYPKLNAHLKLNTCKQTFFSKSEVTTTFFIKLSSETKICAASHNLLWLSWIFPM